jgi:hypothetical protein
LFIPRPSLFESSLDVPPGLLLVVNEVLGVFVFSVALERSDYLSRHVFGFFCQWFWCWLEWGVARFGGNGNEDLEPLGLAENGVLACEAGRMSSKVPES